MLCIFEAFYFEIYHRHGDATQIHTCLAMKNNVQRETNIFKSVSLMVPRDCFCGSIILLHPLPLPRVKGTTTVIIDTNYFLSRFIFVYILNDPFFILFESVSHRVRLWQCSLRLFLHSVVGPIFISILLTHAIANCWDFFRPTWSPASSVRFSYLSTQFYIVLK